MIRHLIALGLFSITASGCRGSAPDAAALEPPAPLIEPELTLTFESAVKTLHQIEVNTWLTSRRTR
jgi:hypothetical protein